MKKIMLLAASAVMLITGCDIIPHDDDYGQAVSEDIVILKSDVIFSQAGGTGSIVYEANGSVTVASSEGWCKAEIVDSRNVAITVDKSNSLNTRYATVTLTCKGSSTEVTVHQFGIHLYGFEPKKYVDFAKYGGSVTFPYDADCPLTATSNADWVVTTWNESGLTISVGEYTGLRHAEVEWTIEGSTSGTIMVYQDGNWKDLGECKYTDGFMSAVYNVADTTYKVKIQESIEEVGYYRLVNPYGEAYPYNEEGDYDDSKAYYMYVSSANLDNIRILDFDSGCNWGYGNFQMRSTLPGKYENNIITFPVNGLEIVLPEYSSTGFEANVNGAFKIDLTGLY